MGNLYHKLNATNQYDVHVQTINISTRGLTSRFREEAGIDFDVWMAFLLSVTVIIGRVWGAFRKIESCVCVKLPLTYPIIEFDDLIVTGQGNQCYYEKCQEKLVFNKFVLTLCEPLCE